MTSSPAGPAAEAVVDAVVIGAGFSGLYGVKRLVDEGLTVRAFDAGDGVGGVWKWNSYPGARTDSLGETYQFSTDREFANGWDYLDSHPDQKQVLAYLRRFADHYGLQRYYTFEVTVTSAHFDDDRLLWRITTSAGETVTCRYFVPALGLVSAPNLPDLPGLGTFRGFVAHTSRWPDGGVDLAGKRVAVIGTGSSGVQLVTAIAPGVASLTVFQRTPNWVAPTGVRLLTAQERQALKDDFEGIWRRVRQHSAAWPWEDADTSALEVTDEERERTFEHAWNVGGFMLLYGVYNDIGTDLKANELARDWMRRKIASVVKDPATAAKLTPSYPYGTKRPPSGDGWYEVFNNEHVELVDVRETPIIGIDETGIATSTARYEVDVIVLATGFDAITGAYTRMDIRGRGGRSLSEVWADGPDTFLGLTVTGFPNMFMIAGPQTPAGNLPPGAQEQTEWILRLISEIARRGVVAVEPTEEAQKEWNRCVEEKGEATLVRFGKDANSWFTGSNIEGKAFAYNLFFGGANVHADMCDAEAERDFASFRAVPLTSPTTIE